MAIVITAWQFVFEETQNKKEQMINAIEISEAIGILEKELIEYELEDNPNKVIFSLKVKEAILLLNKINIYLKHNLIDLRELYLLTDNKLVKVLSLAIKNCLKYYGTKIGLESNLSDDFIMKYRAALIDVYNAFSIVDKSILVFKEEVSNLSKLKSRQENLSVLLNRDY